ncbi:MAG TPA: biotin transporter BioY [Acidimicrobiales bacterium]|nr:biotin transporter BioY [Acidimicrobiales bacterium]
MSSIALAPPRRVLADLVSRSAVAELTLIVGGAVLMGALAQISIHLSFTPVPVTGQTLGVMLVGTSLGWRRALAAMGLYVGAGLIGVPWFAGHASGYVGASFGYLIGFVVAGAALGWVASRGADRRIDRAFVAMAVGDAIVFLFGVTWLKYDLNVSVSSAFALGFTPFLWGELIKAGIAGVALPSTWRLVDRTTSRR